MPIYWRNKLYTEEQKEQLWLNKLDKNKRYVLKQPIDISKGLKEYFAAVRYARTRNTALGYGSPNVDHERKLYELQARQILQETRRKQKSQNTSLQGSV